jgi:uncharacterized protein YjiS (DUF1127 family)
MVSQTTQQAKPSTALWAAVSPLLWIGRTLTALVQEVRQIGILVDHRRQLARLGDRDDRMLADIGLTRCDLTIARSVPLWHAPTTMLKRRASESGAENARERSVSQAEQASLHIPVTAIYLAGR